MPDWYANYLYYGFLIGISICGISILVAIGIWIYSKIKKKK